MEKRSEGLMASRTRFLVCAGGCVLAAALYVLVTAAVPPASVREEMSGAHYMVHGVWDTPSYLGFEYNAFGLFKPEVSADGTTYCWTEEHATLNFSYAANLGPQMEVAIRMAGNRGAGQPPAQATVSVNGLAEPVTQVEDGYTVYTFPLDSRVTPNPYRDPSNVQVDITSETFSPPSDPRKLGVAVDWVEIRPARVTSWVAVGAVAWLLAVLAVLLVATARLGTAWSAAFGAGALVTLMVVQATYIPRAIPPAMEVGLVGLAWVIAARLAPRSAPAWGFGLAACMVWLVVAGRLLGDFEVDDAYISYRYAWNLVHGNGLVFNPGEVVEGYTNFLWTMLSAVPIALGIYPVGLALAVNIGLSVGLVGLTYALASRLAGSGARAIWPLLAAFLLSIDVSFLTFGARGSGMETALFAFLMLLAVALLWGWETVGTWIRVAAGVGLGLAALTRPEGLMVAGVVLAARWWQDWKGRGRGVAARDLLWALVPFVVIIVPYEIWRISYYGYLFPNTFYAKTGTSFALVERGAEYTWAFTAEHWLQMVLLGLGIVVWAANVVGRRRAGKGANGDSRRSGLRVVLALLIGIYGLYIVVVGGDWLVADRFFVPLLAPIVLLGAEGARLGLEAIRNVNFGMRNGSRFVGPIAAGVLAVLVLLYTKDAVQMEDRQGTVGLRTESDMINTEWWGAAGLWLRDNTAPGTWVAAQGAGAIAYYSQRPVIDLLGLNDVHIAHVEVPDIGSGKAGHEKRDAAYVLSRQPDYILVVWEDYFTPVQAQLDAEYKGINERNQRGWVVTWLKRQ